MAWNAVKFTGTGGLVAINAAFTADNRLLFTIVDNGIGISADDLPRIMEPFEQADKSLSRGFERLGLGIPLALAMIHLHGGDIEYESELGHGPTVRTWIPADRIIPMGDRKPAPRVLTMRDRMPTPLGPL
jgi:signal transduction histidine kinase